MSLGLSKLTLLLVIAVLAAHEARRLHLDLQQAGTPKDDARYGAIGLAALLTLIILMNSIPALSGVWVVWFDQAQSFWPPAEAPGRWILAGRQLEVILVVSDLVLLVWGGARRIALKAANEERRTASHGTILWIRPTFAEGAELALRSAAFLVGLVILRLIGASATFRWMLWLIFLPLATLAFDRVADGLLRSLMRNRGEPQRGAVPS